jgi:PTS hybrid protein
VNGVDAKSLLRIMGLNVGVGSTVAVMATGPDAAAAVDDLIGLIEGGFGEKAS